MGLLDNIKKLIHPYEPEMEDGYENEDGFEEPEEEPAPPPPPRREPPRRNPEPRREYRSERPERREPRYEQRSQASSSDKVVNLPMPVHMQVVVVHQKTYEYKAVTKIAGYLRNKQTVVLNLEGASREDFTRLLDFLSGVVFALDGVVSRASTDTLLITPYKMKIEGDVLDMIENH